MLSVDLKQDPQINQFWKMILLIEDHESTTDKQTYIDLYLEAYQFPRIFGGWKIVQGGRQPRIAFQFQSEYRINIVSGYNSNLGVSTQNLCVLQQGN